MKKNILFFLFLIPHLIFAKDFNIISFGAVPDGKTLNTKSIQAAIDAATENGGGRVVFPAGRFLSGTILMKDNVELYLMENAVLLGSTDPANYIKLNRWKGLVMADGKENISVHGKGEINGQGRELALHIDSLFYSGKIDSTDYNFKEMRPKYYLRPQVIEFVRCKNVSIKNVTLRNSACWVQTYDHCDEVVVDSITVISDAYWNNDGIDIQDSKNVRLTNSFFDSADDGICVKSDDREGMCENVYIGNCTVRSSAGAVKFGTNSRGGFKNVTIENIKVHNTFRSAIAVECVDGGILENVVVDNIQAVNTGNAIFIRLGDRWKNKKKRAVAVLRNVVIKNIKVDVCFERPDYEYEIRGPDLPFFHNTMPSSIVGLHDAYIENVALENIEIIHPGKGNNGLANMPLFRLDDIPELRSDYPEFSMFKELPAWGFYVRYVKGLSMKNITLKVKEKDYRYPMIFDSVEGLKLEDINIDGENKSDHFIFKNVKDVSVENEGVVRWMGNDKE